MGYAQRCSLRCPPRTTAPASWPLRTTDPTRLRAMVTLDEARAALTALRPRIDGFVAIRADLAELRADLAERGSSPLGGLAEAKALEARLHAELEAFAADGAHVKGFAPLLL